MHMPSHRVTRCTTALIAWALLASSGVAQSQSEPPADPRIRLPTGQRITAAGSQVALNSMPMAIEVSRDGRQMLVLQAGYETPSLSAIDIQNHAVVSSVTLPDAWLGLTLNRAGDKAFVGGGRRGSVWEVSYRDGRLSIAREFEVPLDCAPECPSLIGDVRLDADDRMLYALDLLRNRVIVINTQSGLVLGDFPTGAAPYRARLSPDREHLIISHWGEASVGVYRLSDRRLVERIPVGDHPADFVIAPGTVDAPGGESDSENGVAYPARLFAACTHADNLWTFGITETNRYELLDARSVAPFPSSPVGSLPSALGLDQDATTLYVANSGNNTVLIADISEALPESSGAIPTAWFPTGVTGLPDGGIAYLSGKGDGDSVGLVSLLPPLTTDQLEFLTAAAVENLPDEAGAGIPKPDGANKVVLVLTDARGAEWRGFLERATHLAGYVAPATAPLNQLAWLTSGIETDFFAKLGPAVAAGRLTARDLAAAGRAALPPAGTIWSNARDAGHAVETYGIGGGRAVSTFVERARGERPLADLTVVRLAGSPGGQDAEFGRIDSALAEHPTYASVVVVAVPSEGAEGAAIAGGSVARGAAFAPFVTAPELFRTVEWLLDLRPATQFSLAARPLAAILAGDSN